MKYMYMAFIFFSISAIAQEDVNVCDSLLNHGISNVINQTTEYNYLNIIKDSYCQYSFSSLTKNKQKSFGVITNKIPVSIKGNSSNISKQHYEFCRNYKKLNSANQNTQFQAKSIYSKAIDAWRECVTLALGGTFIKPSISQDERIVDFSISQGKGAAIFTGVDTENMKCSLDGNQISGIENISLDSNVKSLRCKRKSEKIDFNGLSVKYYPSANVKVKTNTGDFRVELFEAIDQPVKDRLSRIEAQIATLQQVTNNNTDKLHRAGRSEAKHFGEIDNPRMPNKDIFTCPKGSFMTAIHAHKGVGGRYAVDGISGLKIQCTNLFAEKVN